MKVNAVMMTGWQDQGSWWDRHRHSCSRSVDF